MPSLDDIEVLTIDGKTQKFGDYAGKVRLVVNVASKCGFTPQYEGLEALYRANKDRGLVVLGFPCDQFGHQEPGGEAEIASFCKMSYDVTFPLFAKIEVNGDNAHPLYRLLKAEAPGALGTEAIKWNFTKFLVDRTGKVVKRYASIDKPDAIAKDIEPLLAQSWTMKGDREKDAVVEVEAIGEGEPMRFNVAVREGDSVTRHQVTLSRDMRDQLSRNGRPAAEIIGAAFRFLLAREPKESILASFDVSVISRYFPEFEGALPDYFTPQR
jgi:glutathione peroxidase